MEELLNKKGQYQEASFKNKIETSLDEKKFRQRVVYYQGELNKQLKFRGLSSTITDMNKLVEGLLKEIWFTDEDMQQKYIGINEDKIEKLSNGELNQIQLRPFKDGLTIKIIVKSNGDAGFIIYKSKNEGNKGELLDIPWDGDSDGLRLKKVSKKNILKKGAFDDTRGGVVTGRHGM